MFSTKGPCFVVSVDVDSFDEVLFATQLRHFIGLRVMAEQFDKSLFTHTNQVVDRSMVVWRRVAQEPSLFSQIGTIQRV